MYDLSLLIAGRNEQFLSKTVEDVLANRRGNTEIIIGMDGCWSQPPIPQHSNVNVYYSPVVLGQRAMLNQLCRLSKAKYVMKADAHCTFAEGFDVSMLEAFKEAGDNATIVPVMKNLHAFDYVCPDGHRRYQSGEGPCKECGKPTVMDIVWVAKKSPNSTAYRFDTTLHFQYHSDYKKKQEGDLVETCSLQGSCWMMTREKWWELNICDEGHGSWGQQGTEVACATWLSGGRVLCNRRTHYSHLFRTQEGFRFPYLNDGVEKAREYSRDLWFNNKHPKQIYPLSWLIERFSPLPDWNDPSGAEVLKKVNDAGKVFIDGKI